MCIRDRWKSRESVVGSVMVGSKQAHTNIETKLGIKLTCEERIDCIIATIKMAAALLPLHKYLKQSVLQ